MSNLIAHEKKLRADLESLETAYQSSNSLSMGQNLGDMLRLTLLNIEYKTENVTFNI